eukprot:gb/GECG01007764.1/.p1 GENE.gb/GECG01007764.1/~~gb/GECG01007764.1/.p1  ORF type:complete len:154 (+),score=29.25 gb/GECG01007764.1/:1-462(+)
MEEQSEALTSYFVMKNVLLQQLKELDALQQYLPNRLQQAGRNRPTGDPDIVALTKENAGELSYESTKVLMTWFMEHIHSPYPTVEEKEELARQTELSRLQVRNWFTNMRKRHWTPVVKKGREPRSEFEQVIYDENIANGTTRDNVVAEQEYEF